MGEILITKTRTVNEAHGEAPMNLNAIVSYDGTDNDQDALMLGRVLADAGARLTLAYVRHSTESQQSREQLEKHEAEARLERGARWLGNLDVSRRVVLSPSTGEGLRWLAEEEDAQLIIFGSDYRTSPRHVAPGRSAQRLLEGGPASLAIAPAGYHKLGSPSPRIIGLLAQPGDDVARQTAVELADGFGAALSRQESGVDLLVVASRPEAPAGRVMISAQAENAIENSLAPVIVLAQGARLQVPLLAAA